MHINWTISFGDLLTIIGVAFGLLKVYGDMRVMKFKLDTLWEWFDDRYADFPPAHKPVKKLNNGS